MNTISNHISTVVILITSMTLAWLLAINASAKFIEIGEKRFSNPSEVVTDDIVDFCIRSSCRRYLNENGPLSTSVTPDEFDRYFTMVEQNCDDDGHVYPALILAVIAVESNFDTSAYFGNNCQLSRYAEKVLSVADDTQDILSKGDVYRAQT